MMKIKMPLRRARRTREWQRMIQGALVLLLVTGCRDAGTRRVVDNTPPVPTCGDGKLKDGEECDGTELNAQSCQTRGFNFGTLACDDQCRFVTSGCVKFCGNGQIDPGEECDGTLGPLTCDLFGDKRCGTDCKVNATRCVSTPYEVGPAQATNPGGVGILTTLEPKGAGDLVVASPDPSNARFSIYRYSNVNGFASPRFIQTPDDFPTLPLAADVDQNNQMDLAAIDSDGTIDQYRYVGGQFTPETLVDAGTACPGSTWVGTVNGVLISYGCDQFLIFRNGVREPINQVGVVAATLGGADLLFVVTGSQELKLLRGPDFATPGTAAPLPLMPSAIRAGDFDGDSDLDLVATSAGQLQVLENTGAGFATRVTENVSALSVVVKDLDLDGRTDFAWVEAGKVQVRRNTGSFTFSSAAPVTGSGTPLWLSVGDIDDDGDPDLLATYGTGGYGSIHYLLLNKVQ